MKPHNILMLSDVYHPRVNGVSTSIETFRRDLRAQGHRVHLVAPAYGAGPEPDAELSRVPGRAVPRDPEDRLMRWGHLGEALERLAAEPWDVIHVHTPFLAHYAGAKLARRLGVPLAITYHTLFEEYLHYYVSLVPGAATRALARAVSRRQCRQADLVVVPSTAMAERLNAYGIAAANMRVLPTGLSAEVYERGDGAAFRHAHGIEAGRPVALFVGRAAFEKNIGFLLEAMQTVLRRLPDALLLIAGEGPAAESLRHQARQLGVAANVRFLGYLARGKPLADCYAAADVFAFASRTETQGLVLLEAMAQGLPVLALSEMGTRDIVEGSPGAVTGDDNVVEFGRQLAELLHEPQRCAALAAGAREWSRRWHGDALARRLVEFYAELPARRGGRRLGCRQVVTRA